MDYMKIISEYEIWKIANELALEIYPSQIDVDRKPDRERLIDFKDKLREINNNIETHPHLHDELGLFIKYMNPKRKWTFTDLEILKSLYLIQVSMDDLFELMEKGDIRFENKEEDRILRFLFENGEYDVDILNFLYEIYKIDQPATLTWIKEKEKNPIDERIIQRGRRLIESEQAQVKFEHLTEAFDEKKADFSAIKAQANALKGEISGANKNHEVNKAKPIKGKTIKISINKSDDKKSENHIDKKKPLDKTHNKNSNNKNSNNKKIATDRPSEAISNKKTKKASPKKHNK